jgi:hypothetical protein
MAKQPSNPELPDSIEIVRIQGQLLRARLVGPKVTFDPLTASDWERFAGIPNEVIDKVRFPSNVHVTALAADLINDTEALLNSFAAFGGQGARCLAFVLLSTWFADRIPAPPTVVLVCSTPLAGSAVFLACAAMARRSITTSADSAPQFAHWVSALGGTLLIDATATSSKRLRWADGINASGVVDLMHGHVGERSCPRIFLANDALPISDSIQIPILPGRIAPVPSRAQLNELLERYGSAFAGYRIRNFNKYEDSQPGLVTDRLGATIMGRNVQSCVFGDDALRASVVPLWQRQLGFLANFQPKDELTILAEVMITIVHDRREVVSVEEITDRVALYSILRADSEVGARISVGRLLSRLGINRAHTKKRNVVVIDGHNSCAIHQAALMKGLLSPDRTSQDCEYCRWASGNEGLGVVGDDGGEEDEGNEERPPS